VSPDAEARLLAEAVIVARVTLVGGHDVGPSAVLVARDRIRQIHPKNRPVEDIDAPVAVAHIQLVARQAVVFEAEAMDGGKFTGLDVEHGDGVVLLQRHPGGLGILGNRDVLGLEVLRHACVRTEHTDARIQCRVVVEFLEIGRAHVGLSELSNVARQIDDADRALRIDPVVVARLALVGHQHPLSVRREGHHVRQRTDLDGREDISVGIEEHRLARIRFGIRLDRGDDQPLVDSHAVDDPAEDDAEQELRGGGGADVEHINVSALGIDDEQTLRLGVVGHNLGSRLAENTGCVGTDRRDIDRGR
jgi:hypothetical protein